MKFLSYVAALLTTAYVDQAAKKNIIIDTDLFSDVDDAGALLLAATSPEVNLLSVNVNYPSTYSALAASAILAHYNRSDVPISIRRPLKNDTFFDSQGYSLGEYASKIAFHWSGGQLPWGHADKAWDPAQLYRKALAEAKDGSVTIVSIGFLDSISALLNSTADGFSPLSGRQLVRRKVSELVVMGGGFPSGHSWNFWGSNSSLAAHVINTWDGRITFLGGDVGKNVKTGGPLIKSGFKDDPVRQAYIYYNYFKPQSSWDPLAVMYAIFGLGDIFRHGNEFGYNHIEANGTNRWIFDGKKHNQFFLRLKASNETVAAELDKLFLQAVTTNEQARKGGHEDL